MQSSQNKNLLEALQKSKSKKLPKQVLQIQATPNIQGIYSYKNLSSNMPNLVKCQNEDIKVQEKLIRQEFKEKLIKNNYHNNLNPLKYIIKQYQDICINCQQSGINLDSNQDELKVQLDAQFFENNKEDFDNTEEQIKIQAENQQKQACEVNQQLERSFKWLCVCGKEMMGPIHYFQHIKKKHQFDTLQKLIQNKIFKDALKNYPQISLIDFQIIEKLQPIKFDKYVETIAYRYQYYFKFMNLPQHKVDPLKLRGTFADMMQKFCQEFAYEDYEKQMLLLFVKFLREYVDTVFGQEYWENQSSKDLLRHSNGIIHYFIERQKQKRIYSPFQVQDIRELVYVLAKWMYANRWSRDRVFNLDNEEKEEESEEEVKKNEQNDQNPVKMNQRKGILCQQNIQAQISNRISNQRKLNPNILTYNDGQNEIQFQDHNLDMFNRINTQDQPIKAQVIQQIVNLPQSSPLSIQKVKLGSIPNVKKTRAKTKPKEKAYKRK